MNSTRGGKPFLRVRLDGDAKLPSQNPLAAKLRAVSREAESRPAREPSQAKLDSAARMQALESRAAREAMRERRGMEGFKDSTRMRYMQGGDVEAYAKGGKVKGGDVEAYAKGGKVKGGDVEAYAKGGKVKGAAKVAKVMGEFKRGELHSGSKKGPKVTSEKQAKAIALSEARAAGAKIPAPKKRGVPVASREPMLKAKGGLCNTLKR